MIEFRPSFDFDRTEEEMTNKEASWRRDDRAFFAAGACHILAFAFVEEFPEYSIVYVRPHDGYPGTHVFATNGHHDGALTFDHNGFMDRREFLWKLFDAYQTKYPGWYAEFLSVECSLEEFCRSNNHLLPEEFYESPWDRASSYIGNALLSRVLALVSSAGISHVQLPPRAPAVDVAALETQCNHSSGSGSSAE